MHRTYLYFMYVCVPTGVSLRHPLGDLASELQSLPSETALLSTTNFPIVFRLITSARNVRAVFQSVG